MDSNNVSRTQPWTGGALYVDFTRSATLPADATSELDAKFTELGYLSENGITLSNDANTNTVSAWGGDLVDNSTSNKTETAEFTLIEQKDDVFKLVYSPNAVTTNEAGETVINDSGWNDESYPFVADTVLKNGRRKRFIFMQGAITGLGDESMNNSDVTGYDVTLSFTKTNGVFKRIFVQPSASEES